MAPPTVRIHRSTLHAVGDDAASALAVLHAAESAAPRAIESAASVAGDEVVVLRRVDLRLAVDLDGGPAPLEALLESALTRAVRERITHAQSCEPHPVITADSAWFPDEPTAIAEYLTAMAQGRASSFPYRVLSFWGATWPEVLRGCLPRGRAFLGGVLGRVVHAESTGELLARLSVEDARALVALWSPRDAASIDGVGDAPFLVDALPADVCEAIRACIAALAPISPAHRELAAIAELFARWPPARDLFIPAPELQRLAATPITVSEQPPRETRTGPARLISAAGGLLFWQTLLDEAGLSGPIDAAYPDERARRAVRWAVARALEDPRVHGADPMLLLFAGEDPTTHVEPSAALRTADPEPLHRLALDAARARGWLSEPLEVARAGDVVLVTTGRICVDALIAPDLHDAVPEIVRHFNERVRVPPNGVRVNDKLDDEALDTWLDVDVPALPEAWRPAIRAMGSVLRRILAERRGARMAEVRRWPAVVVVGDRVVVEISRSELARIGHGHWPHTSVWLGGREVEVRPK